MATDLAGLTAAELARRLTAGTTSAVEILGAHLERIRQLDGTIRAFLRPDPTAEEQAARCDAGLPAVRPSPLSGIPVAIKDNIATRELVTTCGSRLLERFVPVRDASVVRRLRLAGMVLVGKTNLDEFAMGSSTENSAFGPTRNPWDIDRVPGGSSGGSAAAVAAGMVPLALGSDTGGSVRQPGAFCGVVGLKPTYGRVSRSGLVAFGSSLDQVGILAACVEDAALLLEVIAGGDTDDATSSTRPTVSYAAACREGVEGLRIALPTDYFGDGLDPEIRDATLEAARSLEKAGASTEWIRLPHTPHAIPAYYLVATAEASSNLARYDGVRYGLRRDADGGIKAMYRATRGAGFGNEVKRRIMLGTYALSAGYYDAYYGTAMRVRALILDDFLRAFASGVDLVLSPTTPTTAFRLGEKIEDPLAMYLSDVYTVTANLAGLPALSVPVGRSVSGLPIGAQLIAPGFGEPQIFRAAAVIEASFGRLVPATPGAP